MRSPVPSSFQINRAAWTIPGPTDRICGMITLPVEEMPLAEPWKSQTTPGCGETAEKPGAR